MGDAMMLAGSYGMQYPAFAVWYFVTFFSVLLLALWKGRKR
jgi:hypothetical protein